MGLTTKNPKSWTVAKFTVAVLWMEGRLGPADIGKAVRWTAGQVRGYVNREFKPARAFMSRDERQEVLHFLKGWSGYFGVYVDARFEDRFHAKETRTDRLERIKAEARARENDESREPTKKELKRMAAEQATQRRREEKKRLEREYGYAPRGADVDAVGWLYLHALGDRVEAVAKGGLLSRDRRREAMLKFRLHLAGREISPLQAQDFDAVGAGGQRIALPEYRKFCIDTIGGIREMMPKPIFLLLERIVGHDDFVWNKSPPGARRTQAYDAIRFGSDVLAVYYRLMSRGDFETRWEERLPEPSVSPSRASARADSGRAQDIINELTRAAG